MKQTFTFLAFIFITSIGYSQIKHISFGEEGWIIPVNSNEPFDINDDDKVDFHINKHQDELGFSPEFIIGCLASPSGASYVSFGAREIMTFEEGEVINGPDLGFDTFIDDDRGSVWHVDHGFALGWTEEEEQYIGFILLSPENGPIEGSNGWMRVKVDVENAALIIYEVAYEESYNVPIIAGALTTSTKNVLDVETLTIAPNPSSSVLNVSLNYLGTQPLKAGIYNSLGQKILDLPTLDHIGKASFEVDVTNLDNGSYYFLLSNATSSRTKTFSILR